MNITTALNHQNRFIQYIKSAYSAAESYGSSHEKLIEELNRLIFGTEEWKRCPRHIHEYVHGYRACMSDRLYFGKLTWTHIWEGVAYIGWDNAPEACKQAMRENGGDSAHVWTKHLPAIKRFSTADNIA